MAGFSRTLPLSQPPDRIWAEIQNPALMVHVARGMVGMRPAGGKPWPTLWEPGEFRVDLFLFGVLPIGWQAVSVHLLPEEGGTRRAEDKGHSLLIRRWHHILEVAPDGQGGTLYTDRLTIDAGLLTPIVTLFARILFAHRQRRFRRLAEAGFDYGRSSG